MINNSIFGNPLGNLKFTFYFILTPIIMCWLVYYPGYTDNDIFCYEVVQVYSSSSSSRIKKIF